MTPTHMNRKQGDFLTKMLIEMHFRENQKNFKAISEKTFANKNIIC